MGLAVCVEGTCASSLIYLLQARTLAECPLEIEVCPIVKLAARELFESPSPTT